MDDKTRLFKLVSNDQAKVHKTLLEVYNSLKERGYNPIDQIVGYLIREYIVFQHLLLHMKENV